MIVWLTRELTIRARIVVTTIIGTWMIMMMILTIWYNQVIIRNMQRQYADLKKDHVQMASFIEENTKAFAKTLEHNTEQAKKNAEIIKGVDGLKK